MPLCHHEKKINRKEEQVLLLVVETTTSFILLSAVLDIRIHLTVLFLIFACYINNTSLEELVFISIVLLMNFTSFSTIPD
jgi:hypothetical protein